jgi:hypothetical protein
MMDNFVIVAGLLGEIDYDALRLTESHGNLFPLPQGKKMVSLSVGFVRRDMTLAQSVGLAKQRGFRLALLPEVLSTVPSHNRGNIEEIFRAMSIAAQARRKNWVTNCLSVACASKDGKVPVRSIIQKDGGQFEDRIDFRSLDQSSVVSHFLGLAFVPALSSIN